MRYLLTFCHHCRAARAVKLTAGSGRHGTSRCRWLAAALLWLLLVPGLQAQIETLFISPDVNTSMPSTTPGGNLLLTDSHLFIVDPATLKAAGAVGVFFGPQLSNPVAVDAYDGLLDAFSIDISANVDSPLADFFMRPGEIKTRNGLLLFDPVAAGLPANTNVDALSVDPVTGDLIFSVAETIANPKLILPSDLFRWDNSTLKLFFDGFRVPRALNLDAVHVLNDSTILMSFDTGGSIDGKGFRDEDLMLYNPANDTFTLNTITAAFSDDWFPADVDALYADEVAGFTIGGTVSGLAGSGLLLRNNGVDDLAIGGNGGFTFATPVPDGGGYNVTVATQPSSPAQHCTVSNGSGTVSGANVTNVQVTCVTGGSETVLFADGFEGEP